MKNHQKLTLLFWHRKSKADTKGNAPIICRISIEGEDSEELAIGKKVHLNNWDVENKKAKGGSLEKATNLKINEISVDLNRKFIILQDKHEHITVTKQELKWTLNLLEINLENTVTNLLLGKSWRSFAFMKIRKGPLLTGIHFFYSDGQWSSQKKHGQQKQLTKGL